MYKWLPLVGRAACGHSRVLPQPRGPAAAARATPADPDREKPAHGSTGVARAAIGPTHNTIRASKGETAVQTEGINWGKVVKAHWRAENWPILFH